MVLVSAHKCLGLVATVSTRKMVQLAARLKTNKKNDLVFFWSDACRFSSRDGDIASDRQRLVEGDTKAANMLDVLAKNLLTLVNPTISKCAPALICAAYGRSVYGNASLAHVIVSFTC